MWADILFILVLGGSLCPLTDGVAICDKTWFHVKAKHQCAYVVKGATLTHAAAADACKNLQSSLPALKTDDDVTKTRDAMVRYHYSMLSFWTDFRVSNVSENVVIQNSSGNTVTDCVRCEGIVTSENITATSLGSSGKCVYVDPTGGGIKWGARDCASEKRSTICTKADNGVYAGSILTIYDLTAIIIACSLLVTLVIVVIASAKLCPENIHRRHVEVKAGRDQPAPSGKVGPAQEGVVVTDSSVHD